MRSPRLNATDGEVGVTTKSHLSKAVAEVAGDLGAHPLRLAVVGVVVARGERVGAEHDAALHLGPEALRARALVHLAQVLVAVDAQAVAHAVEAGEVRRRLGRGDHVVGGEAVAGVRKLDVDDLAALRLDQAERRAKELGDVGLDALGLVGEVAWRRRTGCPGGRRPMGSSTPPGMPVEVESRRSRPSSSRRRSAASVTSRVSGPHWSSDEAKAIIP